MQAPHRVGRSAGARRLKTRPAVRTPLWQASNGCVGSPTPLARRHRRSCRHRLSGPAEVPSCSPPVLYLMNLTGRSVTETTAPCVKDPELDRDAVASTPAPFADDRRVG